MNPDDGEDAEDWFAKFEREARESARQREAGPDAPPDGTPPPLVPPPAAPPPLVPPPAAPTPFGHPPVTPPAQSAWDQPTQAIENLAPGPTPEIAPTWPPAQPPVAQPPVTHDPGALVPVWAQQPIEPAPTERLDAEPGSALDALFGDDRFQEYEPGFVDPTQAPFANRGRSRELVRVDGGDGPPPRAPFGPLQKALVGVGGGILAVLALIALFLAGTRLPDLLGPAPAVSEPSASPSPSMTALPVGPVGPGVHLWSDLAGGECLDPYVDAWQTEYTVVDCAGEHPAQMVLRAWFPSTLPDPETPEDPPLDPSFPGVESLQAEITLLCSAAGVVDLAAAKAYDDAQVQGSYPITAEQWDLDPSYYCFVSRSSGEPLTGSVAVTPEPTPAP